MSGRIVLWIVCVVAFATATACMNLGMSRSPDTRFYLLESKSVQTVMPEEKNLLSHFSVGIGPVRIPAYLDRPQIVTRTDRHEIIINDFHHWAEPLGTNLSRVLREELAVSTGALHTYSHPWKQSDAIDYQIRVEVIQFDANEDGKVTLIAFWRVFESGQNRLLLEKRSSITKRAQGTGTAQRVETMSEVLVLLSNEIASEIVDLASPLPE